MAARSTTFNEIAKVSGPGFSLPATRTFIFDATDTEPSIIMVYVAINGKSVLSHHAIVASFTRSRRPRNDPHIILTSEGEEWKVLKAGCGCGSPIRRYSAQQALNDYLALTPEPISEPAPT